jgi:hypothetical protein
MRFKTLSHPEKVRTAEAVKGMLHASRDCMRNQGKDTARVPFDSHDGYYAEAFGIMRGLAVLHYGYLGSNNLPDQTVPHRNLKWWFNQLEEEVLKEEGFGTDHRCKYCHHKYGKDTASILQLRQEQANA